MKKKITVIIKDKKKPRLDWGGIKPYTRIEPDKTKYTRKSKHKEQINTKE